MKDFQIRELLRRTELVKYVSDGDSKVVEEMSIPIAKARIDLAVINGALHGYEIKGSSDTLQRLPNQIIAYSYVFDFVTVVTEFKHYKKVRALVPNWVGISVCSNEENKPELKVIRKAKVNTSKQRFFIAKLLWKTELVEIIVENNIPCSKNQRTWLLCEEIANHLTTKKLSNIVRTKLKKREAWKLKEASLIA